MDRNVSCDARAVAAPPAPPAASGEPPGCPVHDARHLLLGRTEARIVLDGMSYRLRLTRAGKLILTK